MTRSKINRTLSTALLLSASLALSGCGVSENFLEGCCAVESAPPPSPPANTQASVGAGAMPMLGTAPAAPVNPSEKERIANSDKDETLKLRLVQSARNISFSTNPMTTTSDANTDAGGATLVLEIPADPDADISARFTLGNPALGITNVPLKLDTSGNVLETTLADGRRIAVQVAMLDRSSTGGAREFEWTAYGAWGIRTPSGEPAKGSPFVTGYETPDTSMPTSGSATFNGFVQGSVAVADGTNVRTANLLGDAAITANFATGTLSGQSTNIMATPMGIYPNNQPGTAQAWNALILNGSFVNGINGFSGTTGVSNAPGNSYSMLSSASGAFAGRFFGPGAEELAAVWNIFDGRAYASGVLVAGK